MKNFIAPSPTEFWTILAKIARSGEALPDISRTTKSSNFNMVALYSMSTPGCDNYLSVKGYP